MRVYWSQEAARRLREISTYIAKESPSAARHVAATLLRRSRTLAQPPLAGRRLPEYPGIDLRELLERPYRADSTLKCTALLGSEQYFARRSES